MCCLDSQGMQVWAWAQIETKLPNWIIQMPCLLWSQVSFPSWGHQCLATVYIVMLFVISISFLKTWRASLLFLVVLMLGERTAAPVPPSSIMENGACGGVSGTRSSAIAPVPRWVKEAPQRFWSFSPANSQRFPSSWPTGKRNIIISTTWCFLWIWEQLKCLASAFLLLLSY